MKYLCLIYQDESSLADLPAGTLDAIREECREHTAALAGEERLLAVERLQSVETATTVRVRDGKALITDGPFAETKEQLAGFYLIDAPDLDEALRIAAAIPPGRLGCVEVRPVRALHEQA